MIDFIKLEASIKFDVPFKYDDSWNTDDKIKNILKIEDELLNSFLTDLNDRKNSIDSKMYPKLHVINTLRNCAIKECGPDYEEEYFLALFFITAKHIVYLSEDISLRDENYINRIFAFYSAYKLAKKISRIV